MQTLLMDTGSLVWDEAALTEGLRLALGEYNLAQQAQDPYLDLGTISGLDGAAVTLLPELHESLVTLGAAAYCALSRMLDRSVSYDLNREAAALAAWGENRLKAFKISLGVLFPKYLGAAAGGNSAGDPALSAAQAALLTAQAGLTAAQTTAAAGQEARAAAAANQAAAAANQAAADRRAEAQRLAELHTAATPPWAAWNGAESLEEP
jgi:hypothetical protein